MVWVSYRVVLIGFKPLPKPVNMILVEIPYLYINNNLRLWNLKKKRSKENYTLRRLKKMLNDEGMNITLE